MELEKAVLSSILYDNTKIQICIGKNLKPDHFYYPHTQAIYKAMLSLYLENAGIDVLTLVEKLKKMKIFNDKHIGVSFETVASLAEALPFSLAATTLTYYIDEIKNLARRREYITAARQIELIAGEESSIEKITATIEKLFFDNENESKIQDIRKILDAKVDTREIFVHGVKVAERAIWGIVGTTSAGKTEFALDISYSFASPEENRIVLFCEYEGTKEDMFVRIQRKARNTKEWDEKPFYLAIKPDYQTIVSFLRQNKGKKILLIVDYLQKFARKLQDTDKNAKENLRLYVNRIYDFFDGLREKYPNTSICFLMSMSKEGIRETATQEHVDANTILNAIKESGDVQYDLDYIYSMLFTDDLNKRKVSLGRFSREGKVKRYMVLRPIKEARLGKKLREEIYTFNTERSWYENVHGDFNAPEIQIESTQENTIQTEKGVDLKTGETVELPFYVK